MGEHAPELGKDDAARLAPSPATVLDSLLEEADFGLALLGPDMRFVRVSDALARINGIGTEEHVGRSMSELLPGMPAIVADACRQVLERGESVNDVRVSGRDRGSGEERTFQCGYHPMRENGEVVGVWASVREVTAEHRAREAEHRELEEEHRIATLLQVSLRPGQLPTVPGADIASGFRPAGEWNQIGGDFFDVFEVGDGCWMLVIGDVCGKGAEAASLTALARYTLRAAAIQEGAEPSTLLAQLNEAIRRQRHDARFLTAVCAFLDVSDGNVLRLRLSVAGHPAPLRVGVDGVVTRIEKAGALLGVWDSPGLEEEEVELVPGERLVLYTDGVLEAHSPRGELTEEGLAQLLGAAGRGSAADTVAAIETAVLDGGEAPARDDIAMLVVRPDPGQPRS